MTKGDVEIRAAILEDAPDIARIWLEGINVASGLSGPSQSEATSAFLLRLSQPQGKSGIWVAIIDGKLVGWQSLQDFGVTQISRIAQSSTYIAQDSHAKGIGRRLLQHAQAQGCECGFDTIVGWIKTDNHQSIRLVQSLGWKLVGVLPRRNETQPELAYYAYAVPARREESLKGSECL